MNANEMKPLDKPINIKNCTEVVSTPVRDFRGQFGWHSFHETLHVPFIWRLGEKFCSVRMVECLLVSYLEKVRPEFYKDCINIPSYYITEQERLLFSEINSFHCNYQYGYSDFTLRELVVRLEDVISLYGILEVCNNWTLNPIKSTVCGFLQIQNNSIVPYVRCKGEKYFPQFYFDGVQSFQFNSSLILTGWDLSYLKLCFKLQQIRSEFINQKECTVISVAEVKQLFENDVTFTEYWQSGWSGQVINKSKTYKSTSLNLWYQIPKL